MGEEGNKTGYAAERPDHLGIVAGIFWTIGLIDRMGAVVGPPDRKMSRGEVTQSTIRNALGFVGRPLYLTHEFYRTKPVGGLIREGLSAGDLNENMLGGALDRLHEAGVTSVFARVAGAAPQSGIAYPFVHFDTTSINPHGDYAVEESSSSPLFPHPPSTSSGVTTVMPGKRRKWVGFKVRR